MSLSDINLTVKQDLLSRVNARHGVSLKLEGVEFSQPMLIDGTVGTLEPTERNTSTVIGSTAESPRQFTIDVHYNRTLINQVTHYQKKTYQIQGVLDNTIARTKALEVLAVMLQRLPSEDEFDYDYSPDQDEISVTLTAKIEHFKYFGQVTYAIQKAP